MLNNAHNFNYYNFPTSLVYYHDQRSNYPSQCCKKFKVRHRYKHKDKTLKSRDCKKTYSLLNNTIRGLQYVKINDTFDFEYKHM